MIWARSVGLRLGPESRLVNVAYILGQPFPVVGILAQEESPAVPTTSYPAAGIDLTTADRADLERR